MIQLFISGPQVSLDFRDSHSFLAHKCRSKFFLAHKCRSIELFKNVNRVISVIQKVLDYSFLAHKCRSPQVSLATSVARFPVDKSKNLLYQGFFNVKLSTEIIQFTQKVAHKCRIRPLFHQKKVPSNPCGSKAQGIIQKTIIHYSLRFYLLY